jgi:hypothetical protein
MRRTTAIDSTVVQSTERLQKRFQTKDANSSPMSNHSEGT